MIDIFSYNCFRSYLAEALKERHGSSFNLTKCALAMGFQHASSLTKILNGERYPGRNAVTSITKYLRLNDEERMRFMILLQAEKAGMTKKISTTPHLSAIAPSKKVIKGSDFSKVANWPAFVLKELTASPYFGSNPNYLAEKMRFRVSSTTIEETLKNLGDLKLLSEETSDSGSKRYVVRTETTVDIPNVFVRKHQAQMLELATKALETQSKDEREFNTMTFLMDISKIPEAKRLMRKFNEDFLKLFEAKDPETVPHEVYHLNLNFFALTKLNAVSETTYAKN